MIAGLKRFLSRKAATEPESRPRPETTVAIVGDIHGRYDLLQRLCDKLDRTYPDATRVFVGDYIDRGPASRQVIDRVRQMENAAPLLGNHEKMMLGFLEGDLDLAAVWLGNGGRQTLTSFGIDLAATPSQNEIDAARHELKAALSDGAEQWLRDLDLTWKSGNLLVAHAGANPAVPIEMSDESDLLWGHPRFMRQGRNDDFWVAHGHWIVDRPRWGENRISVDTGAYETGRLTAALITPEGKVSFIRA